MSDGRWVLVVDTSVLAHAENPANDFFDCASLLVELVLDREDIFVAVDDGGLLVQEYDNTVGGAASLAQSFLIHLEASDRVIAVDVGTIAADTRIAINGLIRGHKPRDRTLVRIGVVAQGLIATDDFEDFPEATRRAIRKRLGVSVVDACEALELATLDA